MMRISTAVALVACLAVGCTSMPWRKVPLDATSGFYADATLTYRLDAGKLGQPLDVVRVEGQRVSYEQVASSPLPDESIGTLSVIYPHPSGRVGTALARFMLDSAQARPAAAPKNWNPFRKQSTGPVPSTTIVSAQPEVHETWELDIASGESEQIFKMLTNIGFYTSDRLGPAQLAVKMNGAAQTKPWDQIPALNLLIQRVRAQGRLVAYARAGATSGKPTSAIASTAVYRDLMARAAGVNPQGMASAFSLAPVLPTAPVAPAFPATPYPSGLAQRPPSTVR